MTQTRQPVLQRAHGVLRLEVVDRGGRTRLSDLRQQGCLKLLFPRVEPDAPLEAVIVNTSGGIVAGDRLQCDVRAHPGTRALLTTQAAERCYRARAPVDIARLAINVEVAKHAVLEWLPMETILFDGAALERDLTVDLASGATFLAVESRIFGRTAHGERLHAVDLRDRLTISRDNRPILIDTIRLDHEGEATLSHPATAAAALAAATIVLVSPGAHDRLDATRAVLDGDAGASAWNGMLVVRLLSRDAQQHRALIARILEILRDGRPLPAVWRC